MKILSLNRSSKEKISMCCFRRRCPRPVCCFEKSKCERLREQLSNASPIKLPDGTRFVFANQRMGYDERICKCSTIPTVQQMEVICPYLRVYGKPLCPMLVWARKDGRPALVRVKPKKNRVKIMKNKSRNCNAYIICIAPKEQPYQKQ